MSLTVNELSVVKLRQFRDPRGVLVPVELERQIPFPVHRIFWVHDVPRGGVRGGHAHKLCHQYAACVAGSVEVEVFDGTTERTMSLVAGDALHIPPGIFSTERFATPETVLVVLCDRPYEAEDYLNDKRAVAALMRSGGAL
jgi:dTDP-4-dehydrorhamnose 3,5-epimerase-like enzyme